MLLIDKILNSVKNLPTLPTVFAAVTEAIENPLTTNEQLAKILSSDQASAFKVLKVANSPFYGFRGKIDTISQAIFYIGFTEVKHIVFAISIIDFFSKEKSCSAFAPVDLWAHSIGVGIAARNIGISLGIKNVDNYFLAGVLHDVGKIIFLEYAAEEYNDALNLAAAESCTIREAEHRVFGIDHARVGDMLATKWKLPSSIIDTISYHHTGIAGNENVQLVATVHLADIIARTLMFGYPGDYLIPRPNPRLWNTLNLSKGILPSLREKMCEDYRHLVSLMLTE